MLNSLTCKFQFLSLKLEFIDQKLFFFKKKLFIHLPYMDIASWETDSPTLLSPNLTLNRGSLKIWNHAGLLKIVSIDGFFYGRLPFLFFFRSLRRHNQSSEKVNRGMILAPLVGIILNLLDATNLADNRENNDLLDVFASMDCPDTVHYGFQYLLDYNWVSCCHP